MHRQSALASISAARRALSSKLSFTDGDVVVAMANDHPESIRRDRARLLDQRLQLSRGYVPASRRVASHPMAHASRQKRKFTRTLAMHKNTGWAASALGP